MGSFIAGVIEGCGREEGKEGEKRGFVTHQSNEKGFRKSVDIFVPSASVSVENFLIDPLCRRMASQSGVQRGMASPRGK